MAQIQSAKLSKREAWRPDVLAQIEEGFARVAASLPRHVTDDAPIYKFMATQCDFALEHADGSFMDHLHFCADYAALHMSQHSPRVLLLHSICGVGETRVGTKPDCSVGAPSAINPLGQPSF